METNTKVKKTELKYEMAVSPQHRVVTIVTFWQQAIST
jgi:hypothetical protein